MDGFVSVNICDLCWAENRTVASCPSVLKTIIYKQVSTGIKQEGQKSKTGRQRGNKDYESAALTIELRALFVNILSRLEAFQAASISAGEAGSRSSPLARLKASSRSKARSIVSDDGWIYLCEKCPLWFP
jgi:hypothetical protein